MYHCRNLKKPETQKELIGTVDGGTGTIGSHVAKLILYTSLFQTEIRGVCTKTFSTTASAIISYFARKGELLFTNSDQIEADRLCELSKKEKRSVHYMNIKRKKIPQKTDLEYTVQFLA